MAKTTIRQALLQVSRQWLQQAADGDMAIETVDLYIQISERFDRFAGVHGIHRMDDVTGQLTEHFFGAPWPRPAQQHHPHPGEQHPVGSDAPPSPPFSRTPVPSS